MTITTRSTLRFEAPFLVTGSFFRVILLFHADATVLVRIPIALDLTWAGKRDFYLINKMRFV